MTTAASRNGDERCAGVGRLLLRSTAAAFFIVYVGWNAFWILQERIPPALSKALLGLPAPTTGGTRSIACLSQGRWIDSLHYNAMAVPIVLLLAYSTGSLGWQILSRRRLVLSPTVAWAWAVALGLAWVLKLFGDPLYW